MTAYLKLAAAALLPVIASVVLYLAKRKSPFKDLSEKTKQIIYGVVFGLIAVFGTEFGIPSDGYTLNARDAAPVCAGLLFGLPAGIISGVIGGVERFFAAYWGAGTFTQIACTLGTFFAGVLSGLLRKYVFENHRPSFGIAFFFGAVIEVLHMLLVYLTNLADPIRATAVVEHVAVPMIAAVSLSAMLASALLNVLHHKLTVRHSLPRLSHKFQRMILIIVIVMVTLTGVFTNKMIDILTDNQVATTLQYSINDVESSIVKASDKALLQTAKKVASSVDRYGLGVTYSQLSTLRRSSDIAEISVVDPTGLITVSTNKDYVGFDMGSGDQAREFLVLNDGTAEEYVQAFGPITKDENTYMKYAGHVLKNGGFVQVGYDAEEFYTDLAAQVKGITQNHHIGETGYIIICDTDRTIVSDRLGYEGQPLSVMGIDPDDYAQDRAHIVTIFGETASMMYTYTEGYYIISVYPWLEAYRMTQTSTVLLVFMEILVFGILIAAIYLLIQKKIVKNIYHVNDSLDRITDGNLDEKVDVHDTREFDSLSNDINSTVDTLKRYIDEAASRMDKDLAMAKTIQTSVLPTDFGVHNSFDLYACMVTAKEVGGDFYDYYVLPGGQVVFLIADVSGKGVPAALFMMTAKSTIKSLTEQGMAVNDVFTHANAALCEGNEAGMFVTGWMGILDLHNGIVKYANAGHNPPVLKRADGSYEYLRSRAGFVLAGMDGVKYRLNELQLYPGDRILLYTDGVTEATDANEELYGEQRLLDYLNTLPNSLTAKEICAGVKEDVDRFVGEAPQFDDITMLSLIFKKGWEKETW